MREESTIRAIERAMIRINRSMGRRDLGRQVERGLGTRLDLSLLLVIGAVDELTESESAPTIKDIARYLDVHHSRASRLVKDTIRAGYIVRLASQDDARKSCVGLSAGGLEIAAAIHAARAKFFAARLHGWSKTDRRKLASLLVRFAEKDAEAHWKTDRSRGADTRASSADRKVRTRERRKSAA